MTNPMPQGTSSAGGHQYGYTKDTSVINHDAVTSPTETTHALENPAHQGHTDGTRGSGQSSTFVPVPGPEDSDNPGALEDTRDIGSPPTRP